MPPNLDDVNSSSELILFMSPLVPDGPISDEEAEEETVQETVLEPFPSAIPLEYNLRALLVKVTGTEDLSRVTQLKLRVIARDVPLQHLGVNIPSLRELVLDGSVISTLRDLGCGLKNLKILKVNRCGLDALDNMLVFESLEELHAADNAIESCVPLAFLTNLKLVDLRRNRLRNMTNTLTFLNLCEKLEHVYLEGNGEISQFPRYRQTVKSLLPNVRSLDGIRYSGDECIGKISESEQEMSDYLAGREPPAQNTLSSVIHGSNTPRSRPSANVCGSFMVLFPPKVINK